MANVIGRGAALLDRFADDLSRSFGGPPVSKARRERLNRHRVSRLPKDRASAGGTFEVLIVDEDGKPTGFIARVQVSYSRFAADEVNKP